MGSKTITHCDKGGPMTEHIPTTMPAPKLDAPNFRKGTCSCGWKSSCPTTEHHALKNAQAHAKAIVAKENQNDS